MAAAQDEDWSVQKNPFDKRIVDRWKGILLRDPWDAARCASSRPLPPLFHRRQLIGEMEPSSWSRAVIRGHLYRLRPDVDQALAAYAKALELGPPPPRRSGSARFAPSCGSRRGTPPPRARSTPTRSPAARRCRTEGVAPRPGRPGARRRRLRRRGGHFREYIDLDPKDVTARLDYGRRAGQARARRRRPSRVRGGGEAPVPPTPSAGSRWWSGGRRR